MLRTLLWLPFSLTNSPSFSIFLLSTTDAMLRRGCCVPGSRSSTLGSVLCCHLPILPSRFIPLQCWVPWSVLGAEA